MMISITTVIRLKITTVFLQQQVDVCYHFIPHLLKPLVWILAHTVERDVAA